MQHVEFFHKDHFEYRYHRKKARAPLRKFIDFFWETDFDALWQQHPNGFSDALFPNVGYTYLINLGTPFVMQLEQEKYKIKSDGFLPRHKKMICHHSVDNKIFGIKFKVSPVLFQKKVNFSEYREQIYPLAYLIERSVVEKIKAAAHFEQRMAILSDYYEQIIQQYPGSLAPVEMVTEILNACEEQNDFATSIDAWAAHYGISIRTLQRYFEATTSISTKQALQILRIRKAVEQLIATPDDFQYSRFGYYDYSHFIKHLKAYLHHPAIQIKQPHLQLLKGVPWEGIKEVK